MSEPTCKCGRHQWYEREEFVGHYSGRWFRRYVNEPRQSYQVGPKWKHDRDRQWYHSEARNPRLKPCRGCGQDLNRPPEPGELVTEPDATEVTP